MTDKLPVVKAVVCEVYIGLKKIEGLMLPDGSYAVAIPQIATLFGTNKNYMSQDLKRLMGKEFRPHKVKTELGNQLINVVSLKDFEVIVAKLDRKGNIDAQLFRDDLVGLSLHQLFCDAFDIKFEKEERQKWLIERQFHLKQYHPLFTKWGKSDGLKEGWQYGQRMNSIKTMLNLPLIFVGKYSAIDLAILNQAETRYDVLRTTGLNHNEAMEIVASYQRVI